MILDKYKYRWVEENGTTYYMISKEQFNELNTEVQKAVDNLIKKIEGMAFDKEASDITQEYQSIFLDGYNQAIEEVVEYLQSLDKGDKED